MGLAGIRMMLPNYGLIGVLPNRSSLHSIDVIKGQISTVDFEKLSKKDSRDLRYLYSYLKDLMILH